MKQVRIVAVVLTTGLFAGANACADCKGAYNEGRFVTIEDEYNLPNFEDAGLFDSKGEFETTKDFKARIDKKNKARKEQADQNAKSFSPTGIVNIRKDYDANDVQYNADKGELSIRNIFLLSAHEVPIGDKKSISMLGFTVTQTGKRDGVVAKGPYAIKESSHKFFEVSYTTKKRNQYLKPDSKKELAIKIGPESARSVKDNLSLILSGPLVFPYSFTRYSSAEKFGSDLSVQRFTTRSVVMDVTCAAIVDRRSGDVLFEFR